MSTHNEVEWRMEKIMKIFIHAQRMALTEDVLKMLISKLDQAENEFRSVAFEAASMTIAIKDFSNGSSLDHWRTFSEMSSSKHSIQVHSGLGWAISKQQLQALPMLETIDPVMRFRVIDGCGYFDGIFRQASTINEKKIPKESENKFLMGYLQGVGRSLWYSCKGQHEKIPSMISEFPTSCHADLWRGAGIACAYVGGCKKSILKELFLSSANYQSQLSVAAALVAQARFQADSLTKDVESVCNVWCNLSVEDVLSITKKAEQKKSNDEDSYKIYLAAIEDEIQVITKPN